MPISQNGEVLLLPHSLHSSVMNQLSGTKRPTTALCMNKPLERRGNLGSHRLYFYALKKVKE